MPPLQAMPSHPLVSKPIGWFPAGCCCPCETAAPSRYSGAECRCAGAESEALLSHYAEVSAWVALERMGPHPGGSGDASTLSRHLRDSLSETSPSLSEPKKFDVENRWVCLFLEVWCPDDQVDSKRFKNNDSVPGQIHSLVKCFSSSSQIYQERKRVSAEE